MSEKQTDKLNSPAEYIEEFDPEEYLAEYYSGVQMLKSDITLAEVSWDWMNKLGRHFETAIDVGTGPVLQYPFLFAPLVSRYDLSDYVGASLQAIQRWLDRDPVAHDWDPIFRGVLNARNQSAETLQFCSDRLRTVIRKLKHVDLRQTNPLGEEAQYDLVTSFFCTECVDATYDGWATCKRRLLSLVAPGGAFFSAIVQNCERYRILGDWFPTCRLVPDDLRTLLNNEGFDAEVESHPCPEFTDSGFSEFMIVKAIRRPQWSREQQRVQRS